MDSVQGQPRVKELKQALSNLPKGAQGLDKTYDQTMERIEAQSQGKRELAKTSLCRSSMLNGFFSLENW